VSFSLARSADGRLRALWRILSFALLFFVAANLLTLTVGLIATETGMHPFVGRILDNVAYVIAALAATWAMLRRVEGRDWSMVMLDRSAVDRGQLVRGTVLGMLPVAIPAAILYALGWLTMTPSAAGSWLLATAALTAFLIPAAFVEELLTRGYPFAVLREAVGKTAALALTGVTFGVLHGLNPGAGPQSITVVALAGIFLGVLLLATGSLYAATLAHAAWNWVMAAALHTPVSGLSLPSPNYRVIDSGPDWATGGAWGPEAGLPAAIAMILLVIYMLRSGRNRYPLMFRRDSASAPAGGFVAPGSSNG